MLSSAALSRLLFLIVAILGVAQAVYPQWTIARRQDSAADSTVGSSSQSISQVSGDSSAASSNSSSSSSSGSSSSSSSSSTTSPTSQSHSSIPITSSPTSSSRTRSVPSTTDDSSTSRSSKSSHTSSTPSKSHSSTRRSSPSPSSRPSSSTRSQETSESHPTSHSSNDDQSSSRSRSSTPSSTTVPLRGTFASTTVVHKTITGADGSTSVKVVSSTTSYVSVTGHATRPAELQDGGGESSSGLSDSSKKIIGGVVGGILGAILLGGLGVYLWRRRQKKRMMEEGEDLFGSDTNGYSPQGYAIPDEKRLSRGSNQLLSADGSERYYSPGSPTGPPATTAGTTVGFNSDTPPVNAASNF